MIEAKMAYGQRAFENSHQPSDVVDQYLRSEVWDSSKIADFVSFWSERLWLTIDGMHQRVESVFTNILNAPNPDVEIIRKSLKTKNPRWRNTEVNRIAPIVRQFLIRNGAQNLNQMDHHHNFQNELGEIGPVLTIWCHYLIDPISFPPIDKFNYTAWQFITQSPQNIPTQVPMNFKYTPVGGLDTDYQCFREWFIGITNDWRNGHQTVRDVVNFDRSLMSLGAFIQKNILRCP